MPVTSVSVSTMFPVVDKVPTTLPPVPSALMPMPPLGNWILVDKPPMSCPLPVAVVSPIVMPVVGLPSASRPRLTTGVPRTISFSGKLIASKNVGSGLTSKELNAGLLCDTFVTSLVGSVGAYAANSAGFSRS